jgi:hypothetical protein
MEGDFAVSGIHWGLSEFLESMTIKNKMSERSIHKTVFKMWCIHLRPTTQQVVIK